LDDASGADALLSVLRERIWWSPEASPGLDGQPRARIVETLEET
jgi:hypothetical protein